MFIETLEFTIPVDLCDLFSTMKRGPRSNMEFPASVNSYGTTQDANIQVLLKSNKLTFKVDGVSSDASMISKSECKTLKLSIFDVDRSLMPQDNMNLDYVEMPVMHSPVPVSAPAKRQRDFSAPVRSPPVKSSRTSYSESSRGNTPVRQQQNHNSHSQQSQSRLSSDNSVNVKQEPEDPDLIEIEPDPEPDDIVPKKETPYMQVDYSSNAPHTQTSQAALDRVSHPQSSHSQSPASSSSSFHQNVPHVPDYSEPGPSQGHGDQSADDFLVFQEQDENEDCDNEEADFDNDDNFGLPVHFAPTVPSPSTPWMPHGASAEFLARFIQARRLQAQLESDQNAKKKFPCPSCGKAFHKQSAMKYHRESIHEGAVFKCVCGKTYKYKPGLTRHWKQCAVAASIASVASAATTASFASTVEAEDPGSVTAEDPGSVTADNPMSVRVDDPVSVKVEDPGSFKDDDPGSAKDEDPVSVKEEDPGSGSN